MQIYTLDTKTLMSALLKGSGFDSFLLIEGTVNTACSFHIDGMLNKDFFSPPGEDEYPQDRKYALWKDEKELFLNLIKGKRAPIGFKLILSMSAANALHLAQQSGLSYGPNDIGGLFLNFHFDGTRLTCTTGTSMNLFTMDKTLDQAWDQMAGRIFSKNNIPFETEL